MGYHQHDTVAHDRSDDAALEGLDDRTDLQIVLLRLHAALHRAERPVLRLLFPEADHLHIGFLLPDLQKLPVVFFILHVIREQHACHKPVLNDGNDGFELLLDLQLVRPPLPDPVDLLHGALNGLKDEAARDRLHDVLLHAKRYGVLGVVKLVVGRDHVEQAGRIEGPDLTDRGDAVDPGHLDIHEHNVRMEAFRLFDRRPSGLCGCDLHLLPVFA